jgi:UDP-GlcNAc:undecaprenyl-phosphate GlcNAc-1-phosphate transferase
MARGHLAYLFVFLLSFLISFLLVPWIRRVAFRYDVLDHPGHRKVHANPKPLLGGLAIAGAFYVVVVGGVAGFLLIGESGPFSLVFQNQTEFLHRVLFRLAALLTGGLMILGIGLYDDVRGVEFSPLIKFLVQIAAASLLIPFGIHTDFLPYDVLNWGLTVFWIVGITNSFNLLDNMDGLSSGVALIASLIFFTVMVRTDQFFTALALVALAGSILGFLRYNSYPSSIFMGDAGSLFIGYMLGTLTVVASYTTEGTNFVFPVLMPIAILSVPLFDTLSVIAIRIKEGRPIYVGDKKHFSHKLVRLGMTHKQAVWFIYLVTFCVGLSATMFSGTTPVDSALMLIQIVGIYAMIVILIRVAKNLMKMNNISGESAKKGD